MLETIASTIQNNSINNALKMPALPAQIAPIWLTVAHALQSSVLLDQCPSRATNRFDRLPVRPGPVRSGPVRSGPQRPDPAPAAAARRNRAGARPGQPTARSAAPLPGPQRLGAARQLRRRRWRDSGRDAAAAGGGGERG
jgi:hypothetical protein